MIYEQHLALCRFYDPQNTGGCCCTCTSTPGFLWQYKIKKKYPSDFCTPEHQSTCSSAILEPARSFSAHVKYRMIMYTLIANVRLIKPLQSCTAELRQECPMMLHDVNLLQFPFWPQNQGHKSVFWIIKQSIEESSVWWQDSVPVSPRTS